VENTSRLDDKSMNVQALIGKVVQRVRPRSLHRNSAKKRYVIFVDEQGRQLYQDTHYISGYLSRTYPGPFGEGGRCSMKQGSPVAAWVLAR